MMEQATTGLAVRKTVTVDASPEWAFEVFTQRLADWWPLDTHHIAEKDAVDARFEPFQGGRFYEVAADGSETQWGTVSVWDPPNRFVYYWQLDADWAFDSDLDHASEVEVRFTEEAPGRTRVDLEHRLLERFGEKADQMQSVFSSDGGWSGLLRRFQGCAGRAR
jgi:uncharacterized protein YndB with AHSA1/START domain